MNCYAQLHVKIKYERDPRSTVTGTCRRHKKNQETGSGESLASVKRQGGDPAGLKGIFIILV
jgi:hypothetical protein